MDEQNWRIAAAKLRERQLTNDAETNKISQACPACGHPGVLDGEVVSEEAGEPVDDESWLVWFDCTLASEEFWCPSCALRLEGAEDILHAGLPDEYEKTMVHSIEDEGYGNE